MSFTIKFQTSNSDKRVLDKNITDNFEIQGTLRNESSILDPVILIERSLDDVATCNYMTIESFGNRSYFINDIVSVRNDIVEVHGHVDVLTTYKDGIRKNSGITYRQETDWNLYLDDGSFKAYQNPRIQTLEFPTGFTTQRFVFAIAGP